MGIINLCAAFGFASVRRALALTTALCAFSLSAWGATVGGMPDGGITAWAWDGPNLTAFRNALEDPDNFGPAGTFPEPVTTVTRADASAGNLAGLDVFVSSWWPDGDASPAELAAIRDYFLAGGNLLLMQDDQGHDPVGAFLGIPAADFGSGGFPNPSNDVGGSPLHAGPFGAAADVLQHYTKGYLSDAAVAATNGTVSSRRASGEITAAYWEAGDFAPGAGRMVILADVDMCAQTALDTSGETGAGAFNGADYAPLDGNGELCLNAMSFLLGQPGAATLIQAVPAATFTRVAVSVAGGTENGAANVQLVNSTTCADGVIGGELAIFGTVTVPLDSNGDGYVITDAGPIAQNSFAAARVAGSSAGTSACIVAGPDNDSWNRAAEIPLDGPPEEPKTGSAEGFIDGPGVARWFKFRIIPGARVAVELSNLSRDYDLAVFKDIRQAYQELGENDDVEGLNRLGAEFAPSAFTPSAFTPSAFTPSQYAPSAFTPSAFTPSAFTPSVFTPSAFTPSAFTPSSYSPSAFTPSAFTPSAFTPSAFTPTNFTPSAFTPSAFTDSDFASAQTRSLIAVSAQLGTGTERVVADTWNNTGDMYVRVISKTGDFDVEQRFRLDVAVDGELCNGVAPIENPAVYNAPAGGYETVILYDSAQLMADGYSFDQLAPLEDRLDQLAVRTEVNGLVLDLGNIGGALGATALDIQELHAQAKSPQASSCPYAANLTAQAIKGVVDSVRMAGNPLKYVVLVGSDRQIPFFRYPDQGLLGPEQDYEPPMANGTQSQASLRLNYVLGQDEYGARVNVSLNDGSFPIPDLAVGRLVETVPEMITLLDAYLATPDGVVAPNSTLVTSYDFLTDAGDAIQQELVAGTNGNGRTAARNDALITDGDVAPSLTCTGAPGRDCSWTASQLRSELLDQGEDLIFLAGHFSANNALAADYQTTLDVTELAASDVDLTNSVVFAAGCHSGYNIVNPEAVPGVTLQLDWSQAFAQKGATLVAGTGYQYGDTDFIEYSERLYLLFAKALRRGAEPVSVGDALVKAKQRYLATTPDIRGLHRKSLLISTVFGLPMLKVDLIREPADPDDSTVMPLPVNTGPGAFFDLETADVPLSFDLGEETVNLTSVDGGPPFPATYLTGPDGVVTNPGEPALPLQSIDVSYPGSPPGKALRGVGFRGGNWTERTVVPLTGAPAFEIRGVHTPFASLVNYPMRLATPNYYGPLSQSRGTILHVTPAQHRVPFLGSIEATLREFSNLDFRLYYNSNTRTYGANRPALAGPPSILDVRAVPDPTNPSNLRFTARVVGAPAAGIQEVWVTYTDGGAASGTWQSLDLVQQGVTSPGDTRVWTAVLPGGNVGFTRLDYVVQAVNGLGLVTKLDNYGAYFSIAGTALPAKAETELTLSGPSGAALPDSLRLGSTLPLEARLTRLGVPSELVDGATVLFTLDGTTRVATTDNGFARVAFPLNSTPPGNSVIVASFAGNDTLLPSAARHRFTVEKGQPTLELNVGTQTVGVDSVDAAVTAKLTDGNGAPMLQKWVYFTIRGGPDGLITRSAQTNNVGVARLGNLSLPPQSYPLEVRYLGSIPVPGQPDLVLDSSEYEPAFASTTLDLIGGANCPTGDVSNKVDLQGFCYLVHNVKGKVSITNGTLIVGGSSQIVDPDDGTVVDTTTGGIIDNKIDQYGAGGIVIHASASVKGKISESGPGDVRVLGFVNNKIDESGDGDVRIGPSGIVDGMINEADAGSVLIEGIVDGKIGESGDGGIGVAEGASVNGNADETGAGSLVVSGTVNGNATETGSGDLVITVTGAVNGNAQESGNGSLYNDGTVTGNADQD